MEPRRFVKLTEMTEQHKAFLDLAVIQQKTYPEISKILGVERTILSKWWDSLKSERENLSELRKVWKRKFKAIDFWEFKEWYDSTPRQCKYCGITEDQINKLKVSNRIYTKRWVTRGKKLELDRVLPNEDYDNLKNLTFSCYWCNNAKTDEFTEKEFEEIGKVLKSIWHKRLLDIKHEK